MASTLKFDRIEILDGTYGIDVNDITQSNVVQTHLTSSSSQAITAGVVTAIVDLNATITPTRTTSRIKVTVKWSGEWGVINTQDCVFGLNRGGIAVGNAEARQDTGSSFRTRETNHTAILIPVNNCACNHR